MSRVSGVGWWCKRTLYDPFSAESARCWVKGPGWTTSLHRIPQLISHKSIQIRSQSSSDSAHQKRSGWTNFIRHRLFLLLSPLIIGANQCSRIRHDARHEIVEETDIELRSLFHVRCCRWCGSLRVGENSNTARSRREFNNEPILNAFRALCNCVNYCT